MHFLAILTLLPLIVALPLVEVAVNSPSIAAGHAVNNPSRAVPISTYQLASEISTGGVNEREVAAKSDRGNPIRGTVYSTAILPPANDLTGNPIGALKERDDSPTPDPPTQCMSGKRSVRSHVILIMHQPDSKANQLHTDLYRRAWKPIRSREKKRGCDRTFVHAVQQTYHGDGGTGCA
jgi:hypothetical protein